MSEKNYYSIKAQAGADTAEIYIYDEIGQNWYGEGITAKRFCQELNALNVKNIDLHIDSPGGSVFDGQTIHNALKRHPANVTTYIDGLAASIATVIALAGDKIVMGSNTLFMIHNPWGGIYGNAEEMRKYADVLDKVRDTIVTVYREKCGKTDEEIIAAMDAETWMTADEAMAFGFVDEIGIGMDVKASANKFDFKALGFRNAPKAVTVEIEIDTSDTPEETTELACYCTGKTPETDCSACDQCDTCINPKQTSTASAVTTNTAPEAVEKEVTTMSEITVVTPAAGERNHQKEAAEIVQMCIANKCPGLAAEAISAGLTPDQVGRKILDLHATGSIRTPAAENNQNPHGTNRDDSTYSFLNAILAGVAMKEGKQASGLEVEKHQDMMRNMPNGFSSHGGILIPIRNTSLTTGGSGTGAELQRNQYGDFIDILRNTSVTGTLGGTFLTGLTGPVPFPKQSGASTLYWTGEAPSSGVTESNIGLTTVTLTPKTAMATGSFSRNLLSQSNPDAENLLRRDMGAIGALGIDTAAIHGTGSNNQPTGLYVASGVNAVVVGGVPTFGKFVDMATECATDNALLGNFGFATTPGIAGKMMQTPIVSAQSAMVWSGDHNNGVVAGYRAMASNQISSTLGGANNEHGILFGSWNELLIGQWGNGIEVVVDPYTLADRGLIRLVIHLMLDVQIRHPEAFCKATGATKA